MTSRIVRYAMVVLPGMFCGFSLYFSTGIVGVTKKPNHIFVNPGCFCHDDSTSPGVRVWMEGPDSVQAGEEVLFTIFVAKDSSIAAGFNVASSRGSLGIVDSSGTQLLPVGTDSLELTHIQPKPANGQDTISWPFRYRAPSTAGLVDTLYANGNSVNMNFDPSGDFWNFADNRLVRVIGTSPVRDMPVAQEFQLLQNYPNPFNPATEIGFVIPSGTESAGGHMVSLRVYDVLGREVATLVNESKSPGVYSAAWSGINNEGAAVGSGVYLYQLVVEPSNGASRFAETKKMVLVH